MKQQICFGHQYAGEKVQPLSSLRLDITPREEALEIFTDLINNAYDLYGEEGEEGEEEDVPTDFDASLQTA